MLIYSKSKIHLSECSLMETTNRYLVIFPSVIANQMEQTIRLDFDTMCTSTLQWLFTESKSDNYQLRYGQKMRKFTQRMSGKTRGALRDDIKSSEKISILNQVNLGNGSSENSH